MKGGTQHTAHSTRKVAVEIPRSVRPVLERVGGMASEQGDAAYAVGGCVRDWALGIQRTTDLDIAVEGESLTLARRLADALRGALRLHAQFGTATVGVGRRRIDLAMCRTETYVRHAAYPRVSPGTLTDDLFRRDFTINAMAIALDPARFGTLRDPFGGLGDVRGRRLRILHPRSFLDDPSRMLRGIRFAQRFGFQWEAATARALGEAMTAGSLGWLNAGRLRKELELMLKEPAPVACLEGLAELLTRSAQGSGFKAQGSCPRPPVHSPERC